MKRKLLISERYILKRILGSAKDRDGTWKIKKNDHELNNLIRNKNIISCIQAQRLIRFGHVHRVTINDRTVKKLCEWKRISTRITGRPKIRWGKVIKECLTIMNQC